jgi:hypothetical protein
MVGSALACVACAAVAGTALAGGRPAGLSPARLLWSVPVYLLGGLWVGAGAGIVDPWVTTGTRAYAAGVLLALPCVAAVRTVFAGFAPWRAVDVGGIVLLAGIIGGSVAVLMWAEGRGA